MDEEIELQIIMVLIVYQRACVRVLRELEPEVCFVCEFEPTLT